LFVGRFLIERVCFQGFQHFLFACRG